ncbi:MAG: porin family protein [Balneolales bacterium]|nr:porin family protein [Balneolales bacterium]
MKNYLPFKALALGFILSIAHSFNAGTAVVKAQTAEFGINFQLGLPQGDFQNQLDEIGFGIQGFVGYHIPFTPVMIGIDGGFLTFGTDRRTEPLSSTIPDVRVTIENSYNMAHGHFLIRIGAPSPFFRPYIDGLVGFNYLYTESTVTSRGSQEQVFSDTNFDDFAFSYGIGAGARVQVWDGTPLGQGRVYLNFGARYMLGNEAEYLRPGSNQSGQFVLEPARSTTNLLSFQLGVSFAM